MADLDGRNRNYVSVSSTAVDVEIARRAAKRYGNVTTRELLELGLDEAAIRYRVKVGRLYRVHRGVYAVGRRPITPHDRASAAVLACGPGAALSHSSAMTLWGFWRRWDEPFEVTVPRDRRTPGVTIHRSSTLAWRDLTVQLGIRVTSPARTVFDVSPRLTDKTLKRTVNSALHSPWLTQDHLAEVITRLGPCRAAQRIGALIGLPGTPTRSGWEDDFPAFCAQHGLPEPVMGAPVCGYLADALFAAQRLIVELDSVEFHLDPIAFETDRERDAERLAHGFSTVRTTWRRIHEAPQREADRLRAILKAQAPKAA